MTPAPLGGHPARLGRALFAPREGKETLFAGRILRPAWCHEQRFVVVQSRQRAPPKLVRLKAVAAAINRPRLPVSAGRPRVFAGCRYSPPPRPGGLASMLGGPGGCPASAAASLRSAGRAGSLGPGPASPYWAGAAVVATAPAQRAPRVSWSSKRPCGPPVGLLVDPTQDPSNARNAPKRPFSRSCRLLWSSRPVIDYRGRRAVFSLSPPTRYPLRNSSRFSVLPLIYL